MVGKKIYLLSILVLLSIFIYGFYIKNSMPYKLPETFTIHFYGTGHSSGGSRFYDGLLAFKNGKIIFGEHHLRTLAPNREDLTFETIERNYYCNLNIYTLLWLDQENKECFEYLYLPLNIEDLQQAINSEKVLNLPPEECPNHVTCYEIVK